MAKYHRLSEEQLHSLHFEFSQFLATQGIDKKTWDVFKSENTPQVDQFLDAFSDIVWEKLFNQAEYLEFICPDKAFLFHTQKEVATVLVINNKLTEIDLTQTEAWLWLEDHWKHSNISFFKSAKKYQGERNLFIYDYFKKGALITKGERFRQWEPILKIQ